jgi:hypothetical protein
MLSMSKYCKCFFSNRKKYLLETNQKSKTDTLIYYYDKIHDNHNTIHDFSQTEYNNTINQVNQLKQKLLGK